MSETTEPKVTDVDSALNSILEPVQEETTEAVIEEEQITEEATEEVEDTADSDIEEEVESEEEVEDEEIYASESDDENHLDDASQEEPSLYTVKVNGQEEQVTLDDLKQGYSGQKYVQQGMQDAATQKKEAVAVFEALTNERQQLAELYQSLQNGNISAPPVKPTKELFDADPIGYMKQNMEYEEQKAQYDAQMAQLHEVSQKSSEAEANAKQAYLQEQMQVLQRKIPEFADSKRATALKEELVQYGTTHYGYTTEEISQITDARAIEVLYDASRYQATLKGKSKAKQKLKSAKPMMKPGAKKQPTSQAKIRSRQKAKLRDSGSIDDALGLILNS